ncbi:MAG: acyltransferase [Actinomycetota bacterium]|nr:acyltransferase [Actinomycetota bacterium]
MTDGYRTTRKEQFGERLFNYLITHVPSHAVRQAFLRFFGVTIGRDTSIMMGTNIFGLSRLSIGNNCSIGFDVLLDARGGLTIDDDVVLASDVQIITGKHLIDSDDFGIDLRPVHIKHHAWVASRATVLQDVTIGVGGVVGACSMVSSDVDDMSVVAGIPAKPRTERDSALSYHPKFRPLLY